VLKLRCNKRSASTERPTLPLVEDEATILKHVHAFERKNFVQRLDET
jgi:hypothetical protein